MYQGHVHVHIDRTYQVKYLIHPDDTGIDKTTVEDLQTRAESQAVRSAVVAGQASYATSAQTSNANVNKISTDASYSDVELAKKKQAEVEEVDPLDAFMDEINAVASADKTRSQQKQASIISSALRCMSAAMVGRLSEG